MFRHIPEYYIVIMVIFRHIPEYYIVTMVIFRYTPQYYIVKNSHGVSWGDGGYFKIVRGTNACGIEDNMAVRIHGTLSIS